MQFNPYAYCYCDCITVLVSNNVDGQWYGLCYASAVHLLDIARPAVEYNYELK